MTHHKRPFKWSSLISYLEASGLIEEESKKELARSVLSQFRNPSVTKAEWTMGVGVFFPDKSLNHQCCKSDNLGGEKRKKNYNPDS